MNGLEELRSIDDYFFETHQLTPTDLQFLVVAAHQYAGKVKVLLQFGVNTSLVPKFHHFCASKHS